jgi:predicted component of type VI protein secretion system
VAIKLAVEGEGLFYHLPTGMRQLGPYPEQEPGLPELAALFDDPVEKAAYYVRQGGRYFDVRPENALGCARWIRLFGLAPEDWPGECWYTLAILLPCLHVLAGREAGLRLALKLLLELDVVALHWRQRRTPLLPAELSRLGERASRLDVDLIVGGGLADEAALEITVGPVSLPRYCQHQTAEGQHRLQQVLHLVLPYHLEYAVRWLVGNSQRAPRLGIDQENAVLGINSHLGRS